MDASSFLRGTPVGFARGQVTGGLSPPMQGETPRWRNPRRTWVENLAFFARRRLCTRDVWGFSVRVGLSGSARDIQGPQNGSCEDGILAADPESA